MFQKGSMLHELGNFNEAQIIYEQILSIEPDNFTALKLLGTLLAQIQNYSESVKYLSEALKINPKDALTHCNYGIILKELKRFDEALVSYDKAIEINPNYADALNNRGIILKELKRFDEALVSYNYAIEIEPKFSQAYYNRGIVLQLLKRLDEALVSYDHAILIKSNYINAYNNKGVVLKTLKRFDAALAVFDHAISIKPDSAKAHYNKGKTLQELNRHDEALINYNQAIAINPAYLDAYNNLGNTLQEIKQFDKALDNYNHVIALKPDYADAYFNKAILLLLIGDYLEGWQLYEWRWKQEHNINSLRSYKQSLWLGNESLINKTLLIYSEQGFGDYIQFVRYAFLVESLGAKVILEVPLALMSVFSSLKGNFILVECGKLLPDFDYHCPVMSLPLAFKTIVKTIPTQNIYLYADMYKKQRWNKKFNKKKATRVGLAWAGNPDHKNDRNRSLLLKQFSSLLTLPFEFYSLQKDIREIDAQTIIDFPHIHQYQEKFQDFSDIAALIDTMDIIISVDTSVAHLAGAMGKEVWVLLPYFPDFRWMLDSDDSPWYPSAKLYRQKAVDGWDDVLEILKDDLLKVLD